MSSNTVFVFPKDVAIDTPDVRLTPFDLIVPKIYTPTVLCYRYPSSNGLAPHFQAIVDNLRTSLSSVLSEYPILAGRIIIDPTDGSPRVRILNTDPSGQATQTSGVRFVVNNLVENDKSFPSFSDLEKRNFPPSLMPGEAISPFGAVLPVADDYTDQGKEIFGAQINRIEGGILLTICTHHDVVDGTAHSQFIHRWSQLSRQFYKDPSDIVLRYDPSIHDRSALMPDLDSWVPVPPRDHDLIYQITPPMPTSGPPPGLPAMEGVIFHIRPEKIQLLKAHCTPRATNAARISTNDAVAALLWRAVSRSRPKTEGESMLGMAVNSRLRLDPPLPANYFGNVVLTASTVLSLEDLQSSVMPLSAIALSLRETLNSIDNEFLRSTGQYLVKAQKGGRVSPLIFNFEGKDLGVTSWMIMNLYGEGADFGFGETVRVRVPTILGGGVSIVLPRKNGQDEGIEVFVALEAGCMARLRADDKFTKYFDVQAY